MKKPEHISVIGSGLMGHGIAQIFALHGHAVTLYDVRQDFLDKAMGNLKANLEAFVARGIVDRETAEAAPARITCTLSLEDAARDADFIVEAVPENMALKQDIFKQLDALSKPETVLASNTSVMSITEIASTSVNRARIVGTHFWNPPYLIPLVEVVQAEKTSLRTVEFTLDLLRRVGKHPVHCRKDVPGFIANRMQHALWREAVYIVEQGIADSRTVDEAVRLSFGMRLPVLGPMENADMVGLDLTRAIHDYIFPALCDSHTTSPAVLDRVAAGELGFKTGKGLQDWPAEKQEASRNALRDYLLDAAEKRAGSGR
ncbi:MAG: 3-hydroxyacyl-CoA dehydrogenase family protein [Deltaproteobacteria bacterium]|jgi:3-hydroxybutyryl-CoA dehydrogenase|nr:3-hydroxyacyl-CoA dehydrogenase family protein [Deltaproteobacteria bacterium]